MGLLGLRGLPICGLSQEPVDLDLGKGKEDSKLSCSLRMLCLEKTGLLCCCLAIASKVHIGVLESSLGPSKCEVWLEASAEWDGIKASHFSVGLS